MSDREKSIAGPLGEPVDSTTVDERREHTAPRSERVANGTHAQYNVQIVPDPVDKERENGVSVAFGNSSLLGRWSATNDESLILVSLEQIGHLAAVQDIVDILEELFDDDLCVGEEEHGVLIFDARLVVQFLQIVVE